jgi:hypothetical protein
MLSQFSYSQNDAVLKTVSHFDAMFGVGENVFTGGVSWNRTHGILKSKKLRLGYGLRFSGISGNDLYYATAPADLTSDPENIDSILVGSPLNLALNAAVYLEYLISPKLKVGFNIDAIGVGFGQSQNTTYFSHKNSGKHPTNVDADANSFNALLVGDNDLGYLKSEFYVGYALNEKMWIRGGMDMTFAEYTTTLKLLNDNDRFRAKPVMLFLGFSINPFN